ncbi:MAG: hypothetical protein ABIR28_13020, partial [Vicinamibacteria bacterium]
SKLAIQHDLTLLLVLSEHSIGNDWVEHEVRLARKLEKTLGEDVLCTVSLDESWRTSPWQGRATEKVVEESVLSFAEWRDASALEAQLSKLIEGIALYAPTPGG